MIFSRRARAGLSLTAAVCLLAACSHAPAPVEESAVVRKPRDGAQHSGQVAPAVPAIPASATTHTVEKGDTLYSIAFRYGIDFRTLAALNGVAEPFTIFPGQVLTIKSRGVPVKPRPAPARPLAAQPVPVPVLPAPAAPAAPKAATQPERKPDLPGASKMDAKVEVTRPAVVAAPVAAPRPPATTRVAGGGTWRWPVAGKVLAGFNPNVIGPKGLAIGGNPGDPVFAARDGRVVYTGSNLVGYGQLVIVKHDDVYLSAYAHNSKVLVREGESVKAGDPIAEMGSTGADRTKLHFEVRRNGDPVDPLSVLPPH